MMQMNKMKEGAVACAVYFLSVTSLYAQDIEKDFYEFRKKQQMEFNDFRSKADVEFETFLRETWTKYDAFTPIPAPTRPEPPRPVIFDKTNTVRPPIVVKPISGGNVKRRTNIPVKVEIPLIKPGRSVNRTTIDFYGTDFDVATDVIGHVSLLDNQEASVADAWKELCRKDYGQLLSDCLTLKKERKLNDWAYLLFTKCIGEQVCGKDCTNDIVFLQMFLLNKSGYKVRLAKIDNELKLLVATEGIIYAAPFLEMDGDKYYVFEPNPKSSTSIYTYRRNFADAKNLVCLQIRNVPVFSMERQERMLSSSDSKLKVRVMVNKNLIDFYHDYPQCDVATHYKTPMSEELHSSLYSQLKKAIDGKSQADAADLLLNFVQTAFQYKTDGEQFGYEKPNFPDETFYYPYCDCEDRAMLYAILVKDLLKLDTILLDYPNHIASAVCFMEEVPGDYVVLENGVKYLICDPTYIGAPIGTCMEQYKSVVPKIIF